MTEQHDGGIAVAATPIDDFTARIRGTVLRPGDDGYEAARHVWNGMIDKHPALIVRCAGVADVVLAVRFARSQNMLVAVRGGGHNVTGNSTCDGGMVIDLSPMKGVRVNPIAQTVHAQPGLTWREFDHETQAFGLATTGGLVSSTGVAGFTLGGGIGWLVRKQGLACDNLRSVDMVMADGETLTASATEHPDLFWAVRGGGGNFGIVTSFEFQLHPVSTVIGGLVLHPAERAGEVLRFYREFVASAPNELTTLAIFMSAPPAPFIPADMHGKPVLAIAACYTGSLEDGERAVEPLRTFGPPAVALLHPLPYQMLQGMFDEGSPAGLQNHWKSHFLTGLSDGAIETLEQYAAQRISPLSQMHIYHLGGAMSRIPANATAYPHRDGRFILNIIGMWPDPSENAQQIQWVRDTWQAMTPYSTGGAYLNFMGEEGADRVRAAYGENYARLVDVKRRYDPTNFFHLNQNIPPEK